MFVCLPFQGVSSTGCEFSPSIFASNNARIRGDLSKRNSFSKKNIEIKNRTITERRLAMHRLCAQAATKYAAPLEEKYYNNLLNTKSKKLTYLSVFVDEEERIRYITIAQMHDTQSNPIRVSFDHYHKRIENRKSKN